MEIPQELADQIDEVITHYPVSKRSAALPLLHLLQEHFGYLSDEASTWVAAKLELEPINIFELVTFYPMFRQSPAGNIASGFAGPYPARWGAATLCSTPFVSTPTSKNLPAGTPPICSRVRTGNTVSNLWNAWPAAEPRQSA